MYDLFHQQYEYGFWIEEARSKSTAFTKEWWSKIHAWMRIKPGIDGRWFPLVDLPWVRFLGFDTDPHILKIRLIALYWLWDFCRIKGPSFLGGFLTPSFLRPTSKQSALCYASLRRQAVRQKKTDAFGKQQNGCFASSAFRWCVVVVTREKTYEYRMKLGYK